MEAASLDPPKEVDAPLRKVAVFTAIFGKYDPVYAIPPQEGLDVAHFVYTDDPDITVPEGVRVCVALERHDLTPPMRNFYYRLHPYRMPEMASYTTIIYVDGNCLVPSSSYIPDLLVECAAASGNRAMSALSVSMHPGWACAYAEIDECVTRSKYDADALRQQGEDLKAEGFPENFGFWWNGLLVYERGGVGHESLEDIATVCMREATKYGGSGVRGFPNGQVAFARALWEHGGGCERREVLRPLVPGGHREALILRERGACGEVAAEQAAPFFVRGQG